MKWDELTPLGLLFVCYLVMDKYLFRHSLADLFWTGCREYYCLLWNRLFPGHPITLTKRSAPGRPTPKKQQKSLSVLETKSYDRGLLRTIAAIQKEREKAEEINSTFTAEQQAEAAKKQAKLSSDKEHLAFDDSREIVEQDPSEIFDANSSQDDRDVDDYAERDDDQDEGMSFDEFKSVIALSNGQILPDDRIEKARRGMKGINNTKLSEAVLAQMQKMRGQAAEQIRKVVTYDDDTKSMDGNSPDKHRRSGE